jgi:hypothetical protein
MVGRQARADHPEVQAGHLGSGLQQLRPALVAHQPRHAEHHAIALADAHLGAQGGACIGGRMEQRRVAAIAGGGRVAVDMQPPRIGRLLLADGEEGVRSGSRRTIPGRATGRAATAVRAG